MKRYAPTNDLLFKKMLATPGHESVPANLINDFFGPGIKVRDLEVIDPYSVEAVTRAVTEGELDETTLVKTLRDITYGVELEIPTGESVTVTVEMQAIANDRFLPRALYYLASAYIKRYGRNAADAYGSLRPVWGLNIVGSSLFDDDKAFRLEQFPSADFAPGVSDWAWKLAFLELGKPVASPILAGWAHLLTTGEVRKNDPIYLHEAAGIVEYSNLRPEEIEMVDLMEKWRADQATQENYYQRMTEKARLEVEQAQRNAELAEARAEARAEVARKEGLLEGARKLILAGQDPAWVADTMGIDIADVATPPPILE